MPKNTFTRSPHRRSAGLRLSALLLLTGLVGCASGRYHAESLPSSLRVASQSNPQEVDLSRLASSGLASDVIGPGDTIQISIAAGLDADEILEFPSHVDEEGFVEIPEAGRVPVAGLEPSGADAAIRALLVQQSLYRNPQVTVAMKAKKMNRVRVIGAVEEPGTYELPPGSSDLLEAIVAAGGLAEDAGESVEIRNPRQRNSDVPGSIAQVSFGHSADVPATDVSLGRMQSYHVNLVSAAREGTGGFQVSDGGVVMVQKRDPKPIHILGLVAQPGPYDYPIGHDIRVLDAIAMASGTSNQVADKVFVIRPVTAGSDPAVIQLSLREAKQSVESNMLLAPGDVVSVEASPATVIIDAIQIIRFGVNGSLSTLF